MLQWVTGAMGGCVVVINLSGGGETLNKKRAAAPSLCPSPKAECGWILAQKQALAQDTALSEHLQSPSTPLGLAPPQPTQTAQKQGRNRKCGLGL